LVTPRSHATTKKLWSYIKNQRKDHCGVPAILKGDNLISDAPSMAKLLNDYFSSVFIKEDLSSVPHIESM